jgi:hypothetical protein
MSKLLFTLLFVLLMAVPAFCRDFTASTLNDSSTTTVTVSDISSDGTIRFYRADPTNDSDAVFYIVSDAPITSHLTYTKNGSVYTDTEFNCTTLSSGTTFYAYRREISTSSGFIGNLYALRIRVYYADILSTSSAVDKIYTGYTLTSSDLHATIQDDFFHQAPTEELTTESTTGQEVTEQTTAGQAMEVQGQTLAEYLGGYLKLAIFLVISLMAAFLVLSLLVKLLRRSLG